MAYPTKKDLIIFGPEPPVIWGHFPILGMNAVLVALFSPGVRSTVGLKVVLGYDVE